MKKQEQLNKLLAPTWMDVLTEVRGDVDPVAVLRGYIPDLEAADGGRQVGTCPKCGGPFVYNPHFDWAKCLGNCGWQGDVIGWVKDAEGITLTEAVRQLATKPHKAPAPETEAKVVGKKKTKAVPVAVLKLTDGTLCEVLYDSQGQRSWFAIRETDGKVRYEDAVTYQGTRYVPVCDDLVKRGIVLLPSGLGEPGSLEELLSYVQGFIHAYLDTSETFERIASYYVLHTWLHDQFSITPYLRALGDYGTGKSRFLKVVGGICYRPVNLGGGVSVAAIYRMLERYKGTLLIDEGDFFQKSEVWALICQVLNMGYEAGGAVIRCDGNGSFEPQAYECFGPKLLATRRRFGDAALESRCFTQVFFPTERKDIPLTIPPLLEWETAREIRNRLLGFRFKHWQPGKVEWESYPDDGLDPLDPRLQQILFPLKRTAPAEAQKEIEAFARDYEEARRDDLSDTVAAKVLEGLVAVLNKGQKPRVSTVAEETAGLLDDPDFKLTSRKVGSVLRKHLHLQTKRGSKGPREVHLDNGAYEVIAKLCKRYGVAKPTHTEQKALELG